MKSHYIFYLIFLFLAINIHAKSEQNDKITYLLANTSENELHDLYLVDQYANNKFLKKYNKSISSEFSNSPQKCVQQFINGDTKHLGLHLVTLAQYDKEILPNVQSAYIISKEKDSLESYVVLVAQDFTLNNTKKPKVALERNSENSLVSSELFCNKLYNKQCKNIFNIQPVDNSHLAILKLFFQEADVAFVSKASWENAREMNPGLAKKIKIFYESPKIFVQSIIIHNKNLDSESINFANKITSDIMNTDEGSRMLSILKIKSIKQISKKELTDILQFYKLYISLNKK